MPLLLLVMILGVIIMRILMVSSGFLRKNGSLFALLVLRWRSALRGEACHVILVVQG